MSAPSVAGDHEIVRGTLDGISVFSCEAPGTYTGALIFRVGRSDEELKSCGITHLVEHLAIHPFDRLPHPVGGLVDDTRTVFHASGTPDEVGAFLAGICAHLSALPVERLEDERRVLRAEDRSSGASHPLWPMRFGPRRHGLLGFPQYGLDWLTGDELRAWSQACFTRENAVLWFSGPPPGGVDFELPAGSRLKAPEPQTVPGVTLPAWGASADPGMSVSLLVRRSTLMRAVSTLLIERLQEHLRRELGMTYGVGGSYWRLDRDWAHLMIGADGAPGHGPAVRDGFVKVLDEFASEGPAPADLERYVALMERYRYDPEGITALLDSYASDELNGAATPDAETIAQELRDLTPEAIAADFQLALEGMIALVPSGLSLPATRAHPYETGPKREPVKGKDYDAKTPGTSEGVTVGERGVTQRYGEHETTILFADCALVALEGEYAVTLISTTGESIWFQYMGDEAKKQILGAIRAGMPEESIVKVDRDVQERLDQVMDLADGKIGNRNGWALTVLPRVLFEGEAAVNVARAEWANEPGLLALTNSRVLFLNSSGQSLLVEIPREQIGKVEAGRGLRKGHVTIRDAQSEHRFTSVSPAPRAAEIATELRGDSPGLRDEGTV